MSGYARRWFTEPVRFLCLGALLALGIGLLGCGATDGGIADWQKTTTTQGYADISGTVLAPAASMRIPELASETVSPDGIFREWLADQERKAAPAVRAAGLAQVTVYIEEKAELSATTDTNGKFLIRTVPLGKYHLVAEIPAGSFAYKARSDLLTLGQANTTLAVSAPLQLIEARRQVVLSILDGVTQNPVPNAVLTMWGRIANGAANGTVTLSNMPTGAWPVKIQAAGYYDANLLINFNDRLQDLLQISLTPTSAADPNSAPVVELQRDFVTLRSYESGSLRATALDPNGDPVTLEWRCSAGSLSNDKGNSTVFTAPPFSGRVTIEVTGKDNRNGIGKATMALTIGSGTAPVTNPSNRAPNPASAPFPLNGASGLGTSLELRWEGSDPDGDTLRYDLLGAQAGQPLVSIASGLSLPFYAISGLRPFTRYFWQVICRDSSDAISTNNQTWQFETGDGNNRSPNQPANPNPPDLSANQLSELLLTWTGGDPDGDDGVRYQLWIGTGSENLSLATTTTLTRAMVSGLGLKTRYSWKIVAIDQRGASSTGPKWQFDTYAPPNQPPNAPQVVEPASGATGVSLQPSLRWQANDPDRETVTSELFLGAAFPLTKLAGNLTTTVYPLTTALKPGTTYYWQVVVRDPSGAANTQPQVWSFSTTPSTNLPPATPLAIVPAENAIEVSTTPALSWQGGDPDGDTVAYNVYLDSVNPPRTRVAGPIYETHWTPATALPTGQIQYWQVEATDAVGQSVRSNVFRFTTKSASDGQAPVVVAIAPANGSSAVGRSALISVTFSEPMDKVSAQNAVSLAPTVQGTWSWTDATTLQFAPTQTWASGSFHTVSVTGGVARDLAGNLLAAGSRSDFSVVADVAVPSGYRSALLSGTVAAGSSLAIDVPGLSAGKAVLIAAVGDQATATGFIRGSRRGSLQTGDAPDLTGFENCGEAAMRELERAWGGVAVIPESTRKNLVRTAQRAAVIGSEREFFITSYGNVATTTSYPGNKITAKLLGSGLDSQIYVDNAISAPDYTLLAEVRRQFEEVIRPKMRDRFGEEPASGPDGETRTTIVMTDALAPGLIGLFYGVDLALRDANSTQQRESNEGKILYLRYTSSSSLQRFGTVAHEFQHLVNFGRKQALLQSFEETWLGEGLSKYAEEVCGFGITVGDTNTAQILKLMEQSLRTLSLTRWSGVENYGLSYLFVRFLTEDGRYATTAREAGRALVNSSVVGIANVEALTREPFFRTLGKFALCLMLNRFQVAQPPDYGLAGLSLQGTYSGVALPGIPIDTLGVGQSAALDVPPQGFRFFRRANAGESITTVRVEPQNAEVRIWSIDERP